MLSLAQLRGLAVCGAGLLRELGRLVEAVHDTVIPDRDMSVRALDDPQNMSSMKSPPLLKAVAGPSQASFVTRHIRERCGTDALIGSMCVLGISRLTLAPVEPNAS